MPLTPEELDRLEKQDDPLRQSVDVPPPRPSRYPKPGNIDCGSDYDRALALSRKMRGLPPDQWDESPEKREARLTAAAQSVLDKYAIEALRPASETWPKASPQLERALWEQDGLTVEERRRGDPPKIDKAGNKLR